ncbi:MAG: cation diffusion facilitator family transporter [Candidatus Micrarchaeota archaeon]
MDKETKVSLAAWLLSIILFAVKITAGLLSGSLAVLSDAFNSLTDIVSYLIVYISVKISGEAPDADHPYGHRGAQPLAAFMVAVFQGILAFEIIRAAAGNLLFGHPAIAPTLFTFAALLFSIAVKSGMSYFLGRFGKELHSASLRSISVDSRNDVLASSIAVLGLVGVLSGNDVFDDAAAIIIALYIGFSGWQIAKESVGYLMGASPPRETIERIRAASSSVPGVKKVEKVSAHYIGDRIHAEIEILLSRQLKPEQTHRIGAEVQKAVESIEVVERAFIHIDYG